MTGNPYHDEEGLFCSKGEMGRAIDRVFTKATQAPTEAARGELMRKWFTLKSEYDAAAAEDAAAKAAFANPAAEVLSQGLDVRKAMGGPYTHADLVRSGDAGKRVVTSVDDTTPPGHFVTSVSMMGITTEYLLAGKEGDAEAKIKGRIELAGSRGTVYRGHGLKGGSYAGTLGGLGDLTFAQAFDDIAYGPNRKATKNGTPDTYGDVELAAHRHYEVENYSDPNNTVIADANTDAEFKRVIQQRRAEPHGAIRRVRVDFKKNHGHFALDEKPVVRGPKNGTPLVIDYVNGYTDLNIVEGNVVVNATNNYGGGIHVGRDANVTVITPGSKFTIDAEDGAHVTVFPRPGARGAIWHDGGANVVIDDTFEHNFEDHARDKVKG